MTESDDGPGDPNGSLVTEPQPNGLCTLQGLSALVEAGSWEVTATVLEAGSSSVTVQSDEDLPPDEGEKDATVSAFAPDALYRITGALSVSGRILTVGPDAQVDRIQRRRWPRRRMDMPVTVCPVAEGLRLEGVPGRTIDISVGGLCVETLRPVEGEGDPMVILSLPDGTSMVLGAATVGVEDLGDGWRYRLAFRDVEAHDVGKLANLTTG